MAAPIAPTETRRRSTSATASFALAICSVVLIAAHLATVSFWQPDSKQITESELGRGRLVGISLVGLLGISLVAFTLGLVALRKPAKNRILAS